MTNEIGMLCFAAVSVGLVHTLLGPDHYVPFVAMSKVGRWSLRKTLLVTVLCGIGHVGSSILLGLVGILFGILVAKLEAVEQVRADVAAWLLIAFGLSYTIWGAVRAIRNVPHTHLHAHQDGTLHVHQHTHAGEHLHIHSSTVPERVAISRGPPATTGEMTPWILFVVFLFGPCEPLVPLLMYPAAQANAGAVILVTALFGAATIVTMTGVVVVLYWGSHALQWQRIHRFSHVLAGLAVLACGIAIKLESSFS